MVIFDRQTSRFRMLSRAKANRPNAAINIFVFSPEGRNVKETGNMNRLVIMVRNIYLTAFCISIWT